MEKFRLAVRCARAAEKSEEKCEKLSCPHFIVIGELRLRSAWLFDAGKGAGPACGKQADAVQKRPPQTAAATKKQAALKPGTT